MQLQIQRFATLLALLVIAFGQPDGRRECPWTEINNGTGVCLNPGRAEEQHDASGDSVDGPAWIVRFNNYAPHASHHSALQSSVPGEGQTWSWIERSNPASGHPTDFALLTISPSAHESVAACILGMSNVRDLHSDKRFTGKLNWMPEGPLADVVLDLTTAGFGQEQPLVGQSPDTNPHHSPNTAQAPGVDQQAGLAPEEGGLDDPEQQHQQQEQEEGGSNAGSEWAVQKARPGRLSTSFLMDQLEDQHGNLVPASEHPITKEGSASASQHKGGTHGGSHGTAAPPPSKSHPSHDRQLLMSNIELITPPPAFRTDFSNKHANAHSQQQPEGASDAELQSMTLGIHRGAPPYNEGGEALDGLTAGAGTGASSTAVRRKGRRVLQRPTITSMLQADQIWKQGYSGQGIKVGVFDTGIRPDHPHIRKIKERTNWTHQNSLADGLGHGTFVAGVIGSQDAGCPGFAPDVELYTFKVFTDDQVSFTSWFLDAFNYAMLSGVQVINLSIGGPDFLDQPFVDKVLEVTSSGILMISAIGNDGPLYGTLNNPADANDVIGVGGIDDHNQLASFSSRGMTTWELTLGSGRIKPDVMAYSKDVHGSKIQGGCRTLSGTSVASPVVAGAVCLLASTVPESVRWQLLNPASMKQALIEGADRLGHLNMYEQGAGRINLVQSQRILAEYQPRASVVPAKLDLVEGAYGWPYSRQPLYATSLPLIFNATVLNGMGVTGRFAGPPVYKAQNEGGSHLHIQFEHSEVLWPWSGYLALYIRVRPSGAHFNGVAQGQVEFTIVSSPAPGESDERRSTVVMPVRVRVAPPPPRHKRVLWDQFHSIKYPPGYMPRDNLDIKHDILDWHGDHLFTNFHGLYNYLRDRDYYVEVLSSPLTCFNASHYGALLIVDPEDEYYSQEVSKVASDVKDHGLSLVIFGEWYHVESMNQMRFFDDNTRSWWTPATGGANVPALNDLLAPFGIAYGDSIVHGTFQVAGMNVPLAHGADIARMPAGSYLHKGAVTSQGKSGQSHALLGVAPVGSGHVVVYGDSNCLDSSHMTSNCYDFLNKILERVTQGKRNGIADESVRLGEPFVKPGDLPKRRPDLNFTDYSFVLRHPHRCYASSSCESQSRGTPGAGGALSVGSQHPCGDFLTPGAVSARGGQEYSSGSSTTNVRISRTAAPTAAGLGGIGGAGGAGRDPRSVLPSGSAGPAIKQGSSGGVPTPHHVHPDTSRHHSSGLGRAEDDDDEHGYTLGPASRGHGLGWPPNMTYLLGRVNEAGLNPFAFGEGGIQAVILICVIGLAAILGIWSFSRSSNKQSVSSSGDRGSSSWRDRAGQSGGTGIGSSTSASTLQRGNSSSAASSHGTYVLRTGQGISRGSALNNL